jgi:protein SCO1/2
VTIKTRNVRLAGRAALGRLAGVLLLATALPPAVAVDLTLDARILAAQWKDDTGNLVKLDQWKGRPLVLTMAYAACRKTCSTTLMVLKEIQKTFDQQGRPAEFVVVTYAPDTDTPSVWTEYRKKRGLTRDNWHFISGNERDTRLMAGMLDLVFWSYDEHVMHDFRVVIFDAEGKLAREIRWADLSQLTSLISRF